MIFSNSPSVHFYLPYYCCLEPFFVKLVKPFLALLSYPFTLSTILSFSLLFTTSCSIQMNSSTLSLISSCITSSSFLRILCWRADIRFLRYCFSFALSFLPSLSFDYSISKFQIAIWLLESSRYFSRVFAFLPLLLFSILLEGTFLRDFF